MLNALSVMRTTPSSFTRITSAIVFVLAAILYHRRRRVAASRSTSGIHTLSLTHALYYLSTPTNVMQHFHSTFKHLFRQYGILRVPLTGWYLLGRSSHAKMMAKHPDIFEKMLFEQVLPNGFLHQFMGKNIVVSNGEEWKMHRKVISPSFRIQPPLKTFETYTNVLFSMWDAIKRDKTGEFVVDNIHPGVQALAIDFLGMAILGYNFQALEDPTSKDLLAYHRVLLGIQNMFFMGFPKLDRWWNPFRYGDYCALWQMQAFFERIIQQRRAELVAMTKDDPQRNRDMLSLMLMASSGKDLTMPFSEKDMKHNLAALFIAGHDTTTMAVVSVIYLLAKHPEYQQKLRDELDAVIPDGRSIPTATHKLPLLDAVLFETLRIYPPVFHSPPRFVSTDVELECGPIGANQTTVLPKNSPVLVHVLNIHRDPTLFPDPDMFKPDRFLKASFSKTLDENTDYETSAFFAFGGIGMNFSLAEQRTVLSMLVRKYSWRLPANSIHKDELVFDGLQVMTPHPLPIIFKDLYV